VGSSRGDRHPELKPGLLLRVRQCGGLCLAAIVALFAAAPRATALDPGRFLDQYVHETWDAKDGLPEGPVLSIEPTSDGYLWLGTQLGLLRFDGLHFVVFDETTPGLKLYSYARDLLADPDVKGDLWAALVGGVAHRSAGAFEMFDDQQGLEHPFVYALAPGPSGSVWVGTGGSGVWLLRGGRFTRHPAYQQPGLRLPTQVNDLAVDAKGILWAATDGGVLRLDAPPRLYTAADGLRSVVVNVLLFDRSGALWAGTRAGLERLQGDRFRPGPAPESPLHDEVTALLEDRDGPLWIGTHGGGLKRWSSGRLEPAPMGRELAPPAVLALAEDPEGSLWVGTDRGLERYRDGAFVTFGPEHGLEHDNLLNLAPRRAGGLWVLDGSGAILVFDKGEVRQIAPRGTVPGLGMLDMRESADGSLWVGGPELLRLHDGVSERLARPGGSFSLALPDGDGLLVVQTRGDGKSTLSRLEGGTFTPIPTGAPLVHAQRLYRDRRGRLWISTGGAGLVRLEPGGKTRVFRAEDGLPHDTVYGLEEDETGALWVGTRGGLARIEDDQVTGYAAAPGVPHRSPLHLHCDSRGFLWVASDDGVFRIRRRDLEEWAHDPDHPIAVMRFTTQNGLRSIEVSWRPAAQAATDDGRLWYATSRGLSVVDPAAVVPPPPPPVYIEEVLAGGTSAEKGDPVVIGPGRERIEIRFAAPSLTLPGRQHIRYRLIGYDAGWIEAPAGRSAYYTNLPAGSYVFRVAAQGSGGSWEGSNEAAVRLRVEPVWYETALARLLALAAAGLTLVGVHRLRVRHMRRREQTLRRRVAERTEQLEREVTDRRHAEDEVRQLNEQLEQRVRERTAQLEDLNRALEDDVAQRRRAEAALADEKERLAVTLRSLAEAVVATDVEGRVGLMNSVAELHTGWSAREAMGRRLTDVLRAVDRFSRRPIEDPVASVLASDLAVSVIGPALLVSRTGDEVLFEGSAAPIRDHESRTVGAVLVFRDVTERTQAEEQLQKAQKLEALGVLAAGIAHDFNNLLTGLFGKIDLARAQAPAGSQVAARLKGALDVLEDARGLSSQLLTFSEGGKPATEPHSLGALLQNSARLALSGSNVSATLELPDDLWACQVDRRQIRQTINNLLLNARQAMPNGGRVVVRAANRPPDPEASSDRRFVEVEISDRGPGIPAEIRDRVFDPFFSTKPSCSGLGLAIAHSIVTQHGGTLELASAEGGGTTVRLRLPAAEEEPVAETPPAHVAPRHVPVRILFMDDQADVREVAEAALNDLGHEVELRADADSAVAAFRRAQEEGRPFDLAILDLTIAGGKGGVEALGLLRGLDPGIRVIATSGYSSGPVLAEPARFGFDGALPKPFTIAELAAAVASLLGRPEAPSQ